MAKIHIELDMDTGDLAESEVDLDHESGLTNAAYERLTGELADYGSNIEFTLVKDPITSSDQIIRTKKKKPYSGPRGVE